MLLGFPNNFFLFKTISITLLMDIMPKASHKSISIQIERRTKNSKINSYFPAGDFKSSQTSHPKSVKYFHAKFMHRIDLPIIFCLPYIFGSIDQIFECISLFQKKIYDSSIFSSVFQIWIVQALHGKNSGIYVNMGVISQIMMMMMLVNISFKSRNFGIIIG